MNSMEPHKISIITTFYNAQPFIEKALSSIESQYVDPRKFTIEYVIVDDKSEDESRRIVERFIKQSKNKGIEWKLYTPENNLGCGGARKFGISKATGDFFMFLDADDYYINKDFVLRAYKTITEDNADIVEFGILYHQSNGASTKSVSPQKLVIENNKTLAQTALFKDNLIKFNVWTKIYRRWIVESFEYSDSREFEDVRTIPVWINNANKIVIMPSIEINYRAAGGSIIRKDWNKTRIGTISAIATHFERFKNNKEVLKAMYQRSMVDLETMLNNHSSENDGFNEMSKLNTYMLKYIYPNSWQDKVFEV